MAVPNDRIQIQMFNVGFGDAFLIILPGPCKVLIDCGTIAQGSVAMSDVVGKIMDEVRDKDGVCRIDVVVATHRHKDHVSGFADPRWHEVEVREVWMPWTEDPNDARAKHIRDAQSRLAKALYAGWTRSLRAALDPSASERAKMYQHIAFNALSNDKAMSMLHKGFAGGPRRRFLHGPTAGLATVSSDLLGNATAYVLGPSLDEAVIRDMNPPEGATYLSHHQAVVDRAGDQNLPFEPFEEDWGLKTAQYRWHDLIVETEDAKRLKHIAETDEASLTVSLDKAVNGTSLVLVFELRDAVLLFPGDAQWGTWRSILRDVEARGLVSRATFFKVGHHGSHNATPREFVEDVLARSCCSMVSTLTGKWASIPRLPLMDALTAKTLLTRSDEQRPAEFPIVMRTSSVTIAEIPIQSEVDEIPSL